jgi:hypothetical protein
MKEMNVSKYGACEFITCDGHNIHGIQFEDDVNQVRMHTGLVVEPRMENYWGSIETHGVEHIIKKYISKTRYEPLVGSVDWRLDVGGCVSEVADRVRNWVSPRKIGRLLARPQWRRPCGCGGS